MQDIRLPVTVGGITFKNPFYVASGPTTKTVAQLVRIEETGWAAASIKLSIDPAPYINRKPRYDLFEDRNALAFTTEKRLTFEEGLTLVREGKKVLNDLILFANITYAGDDGVPGWVNMAKEFEKAGADVIELNMCCPNMSFNVSLTTAGAESTAKQTGASLGQQEDAVAEIVRAIKKEISIPLFVKLTPEGGRIAPVAKALYEAGADAVSGTANRMAMPLLNLDHPEKAVYHLQEEVSMSCYCGPWLKPLAQRDTYEMRKLCGDEVKIAATGGISGWRDAVEMVLCGGDLLGVCAETLISGYDIVRPMLEGMRAYMDKHGYQNVEDFRGLIVRHLKTAPEVTLYGGVAEIARPNLAGPCKAACPWHVPAQAYVQMVGRGQFAESFKVITEKGLLQGACAYVCPHPCEDACVRGAYGKPVRIRELKRYVLEKGRVEGWKPDWVAAPANGKKVAACGAGAAGVTAAFELARAGYAVTLFEKEPRIGGILRAMMAEGQIPPPVLVEMEAALAALGVEVKTGVALGDAFTEESLLGQGYDAVFVATGAAAALPDALRSIPGAEWIRDAEELVIAAANGTTLPEKSVAILASGLYGLQAALAARAAGAEEVFLACARLNHKQSAQRGLLALAKQRGIVVLEGLEAREVLAENGRPSALALTQGAIRTTIPCAAVYAATAPVPALNPANERVFHVERNVVGGPDVIGAVQQGAKIAIRIDGFLRGAEATLVLDKPLVSAKRADVIARTGVLPFEEAPEKERPIETDDEAVAEASRCLGCGCGEGCQLCKTICTDFAPRIVARDELAISSDECVACGMCYNRCPNGNIQMVSTGQKV